MGGSPYPPSMPLESRPYASLDDLREMQAGVTQAWLTPRRPLISCSIGDLAWWYAGAGPGIDWSERIRIWTHGGSVVGWGFFRPPASLDWFALPRRDEADERQVLGEILDWGDRRVAASRAVAHSGDPAPSLEVFAADGWLEADVLRERGFVASDPALVQYFQSLDRELPEPAVPDGYRVRTVAGAAEIPARVDVHRAAFAPSKLTVEKYEILVGLETYDYTQDAVVEAPDGSFAAFTMCWLDRTVGLGYFEPVGTHPDHRRRGLGKAVNTFGLRLLQAAGAREAMVYSEASTAASRALYESVGFTGIAVHRAHRRPDPAADLQSPG
jgi:ribosomal protein S18 acetylase RimI-like enzyme